MFGDVDLTKPYFVIKVTRPVKIMPLRRAVLAVGEYRVQGDCHSKLRGVKERRMMEAGLFSVVYHASNCKG